MPDGQHPAPSPLPILRGEQVYLRPAERSDLPLFVRWLADAEVARNLAVRSPISQAMEDKWFDQVVEQQGRDRYHFTICLLSDGRPIGATDLREINMLYLARADGDGRFAALGEAEQPIFDTLAIAPGGGAFSRARFSWAPDGDGLAVWDAWWAGVPQAVGFPDEKRVYFGHPLDGTMIGPPQALDAADTRGGQVVQVSLAGGPYLALTVVTQEGSEGGTFGPTAELRLVTRNLGNVPDDVQTFGTDKVWNGPAFYPAVVDGESE